MGPQTEAWLSDADETFYGGAAGGGKSDLALGLAATRHRKSIIFRREYPQLQDMVARSRALFSEYGRFTASPTPVWRFNDGRSLEFGAVQLEEDVRKYRGRPHDLKEFDELPEFSEKQYRFLIAWNRTTIPGQRCRVLGTGNPPSTPEGEWVIRYWAPWLDPQHARPAKPAELRWYITVDDKDEEVESGAPFTLKSEMRYPRSRTFIPAVLSDNPYLVATGYEAVLDSLPEPLRSQLKGGDFRAGISDDPWQVIPTAWVEAAMRRWTEAGGMAAKPQHPMTCVGCDPARGGGDKTVLAPRWGAWYAPLDSHPGKATPKGQDVRDLLIVALLAGGCANVDSIGIGASVVDLSREIGLNVVPIDFSSGAPTTDRTGLLTFRNFRAYAYWSMREALDPIKGDGLMLPPDPELKADLCAAKWKKLVSGIQVEPKEDIIKRLRRSPDKGDAVVLASVLGGETEVW